MGGADVMVGAGAMSTTTLYRFYDKNDQLLYVGISSNPARRAHEHSKDKPWWADVARSIMEHHPTRESAAAAEVAAIVTESPLHNVVHNGPRPNRVPRHGSPLTQWRSPDPSGPFVMQDRYGDSITTRLVLRPEPHLSPCVDEVYVADPSDPWDQGRDEAQHWFVRLSREHGGLPEKVGIYWAVDGLDTSRVFATAPLGGLWGNRFSDDDDFLAHYTWPRCAATGQPVNWLHLPVVMDRFPLWADVLGWIPSPLQADCPVGALYEMFLRMTIAVTRGDARVYKGSR